MSLVKDLESEGVAENIELSFCGLELGSALHLGLTSSSDICFKSEQSSRGARNAIFVIPLWVALTCLTRSIFLCDADELSGRLFAINSSLIERSSSLLVSRLRSAEVFLFSSVVQESRSSHSSFFVHCLIVRVRNFTSCHPRSECFSFEPIDNRFKQIRVGIEELDLVSIMGHWVRSILFCSWVQTF